MKIIVVGCGKIGVTLISSLVSEGHDVTAIDSNPDVISQITDLYDVMGVCGNGVDCEVLESADASDAELLVSTTDSDEFNMLSCFLARKLGTHHTIARIRSPQYNDQSLGFMREHLNLSMVINPEYLAAKELYLLLRLPSAAKIETFSAKNFEMIELKLKPDSMLNGLSLSALRSKFTAQFLICAVERENEAYIPDGNFILKSGDKIALAANHSELSRLLKEMGILHKKARNIMLLGGSRTSYYLTKMLTAAGNKVTIIERDRSICEDLCDKLPKATIINGDAANQELLLEEGLHSLDAFVTLTGIDEENILLSSFAATKGVPKVITKINRDELIPLAERWGLDSFVSPKRAISDLVIRYARALENSQGSSVESLYKMMDEKVEVLEFIVKPNFPQLNISFKDLKTKKDTLIAAIMRNRKIIIPSGSDCLMSGDKVIVIATNQRINNLSDILR